MNFISKIDKWLHGGTALKSGVALPRVNVPGLDDEANIKVSNFLNNIIAFAGHGTTKDTRSYLGLFRSVPEVFFPIDYIARRISGAHFEIKRYKDDSIVWCTGRSYKAQKIARILSQPNCLQKWKEFIYMHEVFKLATGNAFMRAAMSDLIVSDEIWKYCDNYWSIPPDLVDIVPAKGGLSVPLFGIASIDDIIEGYRINAGSNVTTTFSSRTIWHDRDVFPDMLSSGTSGFMKSHSRLESLRPTLDILSAVYSSRNTIYTKSGALGIISSKKKDEAGSIALTETEKKQLRTHYASTYGIGDGQSPVAITDADVDFIRTALSIKDLEPFTETLNDAILIAGVYGIPSDLVPRQDKSTYANQITAEKGVYASVIIPMAEQFCADLTTFLGIEEEGYYISCNFDNVDCLQVGLKESENVKKLVNDRCRQQFIDGLISINDWRAQIHESAFEENIFGKTKFEMTPEELNYINSIINNTTTPQQEKSDGKEKKSDFSDEDE